MIKPEQGGSFYDDFADNEAPVIEQKPLVREVGWQSPKKVNERYRDSLPDHVKDSMRSEQKDESSAGYWRMFTAQNPDGSFEQSVNLRFGGREAIGGMFREKKIEYVNLYREMMGSM